MIDKNDLRIAYFNGNMVEGQDGVTRTLFKIADFLNENEIKSIFFAPIFNQETTEKINIKKVNSIQIPFYKDYHLPIPNSNQLSKILDYFEPHLLHIHSPCPLGKFAIKYAKTRNLPVVATYHTHFPSYIKYYKVDFVEQFGWDYLRKLYNSCDAVFVPSKTIIDELQEHNFQNLIHLPNGIELKIFDRTFKNEDWKKKYNIGNKKVLLFVGRLVWEKDLQLLIEINKYLKTIRDDYIFVFVGDGPAEIELKKNIKESIFLGRLYGKDLSEAYASSDLFVFPSTTETFGIVILEAMASGIPAICSNINGPADIIQNYHNGILVKPKDEISFAQQINLILNDSDLYDTIQKNALESVKLYEWNSIFQKMLTHYQEFIEDHSFIEV
jgi:glycosyltransferase involved in cell wall biosynthesis